MRSLSSIFLIILTFSFIFLVTIPPGLGISFPNVTTYYNITGQMCYEGGGFVESYLVEGEMKAVLEPITPSTVNYDSRFYYMNAETGIILESEVSSGTLVNRQKNDGNFTLFYSDLPAPSTQFIDTCMTSVEAHYVGARYVAVDGKYVKAHYYCYTISEMQSILRFEWWFEWETGVLLQFTKSIETNLVRVQWLDYSVKNTTLSLDGSHPITAFFANFRENFFAIFGAILAVIILFYYIIQKKIKRREGL